MNFTAFYLGAIFFDHSGPLSGIAVFLLTALTGTIVASGVEKCIASLWGNIISRYVDRIARYSAETLYLGRRSSS